MAANEAKVLKEALALPPKQRARVVVSIIDSLDAQTDENVEDAWRAEVARRVQELEDGVVQTVSWAEARRTILR